MSSKTLAIIIILVIIGTVALSVIKNNRISGSVTDSAQNNNDMSDHHKRARIDSSKLGSKISFEQAVGKVAPDFALTNQNGETFKLSEYRGKNIVLFFNEGSMCYPACWNQIAALANDPRINNDETVAVSIVIDSKYEWDKILKSQPKLQKATILFDTDTLVSEIYDALDLESSMHKGSFPGHTYFIVNKEGIISFVLDDPNMAINNDVLASNLA